jgi:hypothetical protein
MSCVRHTTRRDADVTNIPARVDLEPFEPQRVERLEVTFERLTIAGAAMTAYHPTFGADGRTLQAARLIGKAIATGIRRHPTSDTS